MPITNDLAAVRAILETDRVWSVYALADLAPPYRAHAEWHVEGGGLLLVYRAFTPPVLFAMGAAEDPLREIAAEPAFYLSVRPETAVRMRAAGYRMSGEKRMLRMALQPARFAPPPELDIERLGPADEQELRRLFADGGETGEAPVFFDAGMLRHGVYFGVRENGALPAAAGTHVFAPEAGVGALGNIYTRRDRRRRGLARRATAAVTAELLRLGLRTIALNVEARNEAAIRVYERLGFAPYCEYREGLVGRA